METLKKVLSNAIKMASRNIFRDFFHPNFFMFVLLISNHLFFTFNLKLICTCEFFKKLTLHSPKQLVQFHFLKNSLMQINSKLNSKPYDYLY